MNRVVEFFQDESKQLSMTRLLCFLAFWPASYVVCIEPDSDTLGWYLGAFVGGYAAGKWADRKAPATIVTAPAADSVQVKGENVNVGNSS